MMTQQEVGKELVSAGLGDWNSPGDTELEYEAYGDGKLNMVYVEADGRVVFKDGYDKELWSGYIEDDGVDMLLGILDKFGHYAPC